MREIPKTDPSNQDMRVLYTSVDIMRGRLGISEGELVMHPEDTRVFLSEVLLQFKRQAQLNQQLILRIHELESLVRRLRPSAKTTRP